MRLVSQEKDLASRQPEKRPGTSSLSASCCGRILGQLGDGEKNTSRYSHVFCFTEERVFTFLRFSGEPPAVVVCNLIPSSGGGGWLWTFLQKQQRSLENQPSRVGCRPSPYCSRTSHSCGGGWTPPGPPALARRAVPQSLANVADCLVSVSLGSTSAAERSSSLGMFMLLQQVPNPQLTSPAESLVTRGC